MGDGCVGRMGGNLTLRAARIISSSLSPASVRAGGRRALCTPMLPHGLPKYGLPSSFLQFGLFSFSGQLHRCFRLHVESLKKLGKQAQGCKMVTLWLAALQPSGPEHMTEPVTFWVRVKMDAARAGDKELQLK